MKALLYCRVVDTNANSTLSLDAQEMLMVHSAQALGYEYEVIRENAGPTTSRSHDKLAEALDLLDQHQADILMAVRLDLILDRKTDVATLVERSERGGWAIVLSGDGHGLHDTTGPGPRLTRVVSADVRERISRRTREAMQRQKAEGILLGRPVDPTFIATYREVLAMVGRGMSYNAVARTLNSQGISTAKGRTWYASTVKAIVESETAKRIERPQTG